MEQVEIAIELANVIRKSRGEEKLTKKIVARHIWPDVATPDVKFSIKVSKGIDSLTVGELKRIAEITQQPITFFLTQKP